MNTSLDCLPCIFRQTLDAVKRVSDDPALGERVVREVAGWICTADLRLPPPVMAQRLHRFLRGLTGIADPYANAKARDNALALSLMPELRERLAAAPDPLLLAVRLAIAGNLIDLGPKHDLSAEEIRRSIRQVLDAPFSGDVETFRQAVAAGGAQALVTGHCGPKAFRVLAAAGVKVYTSDAPTVAAALELYREGKLKESVAADVEGHWA